MHTFGVRVVTDFRKSKSGPWIGPTHLILLSDMHGRRREANLVPSSFLKCDGEFAVTVVSTPSKPLEKIDVKKGAAELAVGDSLQAHMLLGVDDFADALVLDRVQFLRREMAGGEALARCSQPLRAQIAADMIGAKRRTGHASSLENGKIDCGQCSHAGAGLGKAVAL